MRLTIPYLDADAAAKWAALSPLQARAVLDAARLAVGRTVGYRGAADRHGVADLADLVTAIAGPVLRRRVEAPWPADVASTAELVGLPPEPPLSSVAPEGDDSASILADYVADGRLTQQQALVAALLSVGSSMAEVTRQSGASRKDITAWKSSDLQFQRAMDHILRERTEALFARAAYAQHLALTTLEQACLATDDTGEPLWQVRQRAADSLLDRGRLLVKGERTEVSGEVVTVDARREDVEAVVAEIIRSAPKLIEQQEDPHG